MRVAPSTSVSFIAVLQLLVCLAASLVGAPALAQTAQEAPATRSNPTTRPKPKPLPPPPPGVIIRENVAYLPAERAEKLDLYLPADRATGTRSPAVVLIHGGGWVGGDKAAPREFNIGTTLAREGFVCASVNYQLDADNRWPTNLQDCKNAVRFLRAKADELGVDSKHIGVIGGSAGGHLALMVAYTTDDPALEPETPYPGISSGVSAVVDLYGITNLLTRRKTDAKGNAVGEPSTRTALMQKSASEDQEAWKAASPVLRATPQSPPTLILHGTADATVNREQATELAARLKELGVEHQIIMLDDIGHTFDLQTWRKKPLPMDLRPVVIDFFKKHLVD